MSKNYKGTKVKAAWPKAMPRCSTDFIAFVKPSLDPWYLTSFPLVNSSHSKPCVTAIMSRLSLPFNRAGQPAACESHLREATWNSAESCL